MPRPRLMDSTVPAVPHSARMLPQKNALQEENHASWSTAQQD